MTNRAGWVAGIVALAGMVVIGGESALAQSDRVLVVYNANLAADQDGDGTNDSKQVAAYYMAKRGVPASNMLGLSITRDAYVYTGDYSNFQAEVVQPIKTKLSSLGATNIDIILLCYGVPFQVMNSSSAAICLDNALMALNYWNSSSDNIGWYNNPYFATRPTFETDKPHFTHASYKFSGTEMYLVGRIDGANANAAMNLVDMALYGERYITLGDGYYNGTVYVDSRAAYTDAGLTASANVINGSYGDYGYADENIAYTEHYAASAGFKYKWEQSGSVIGTYGTTFTDGTSAATAPGTLFYAGWYGGSSAPFEWLAGSIGCHLHSMSFSGGPAGGSWDGTALALGAAAVGGTINEPFLTGIQRPNLMIYYVLKGYNFAEASTLSTPSVGWMPLNVGDPLYTPMKAKTPVIDTQSPSLATGYPAVGGSSTSGTRPVTVRIQDSPEPEVARMTVEYGLTTAYGSAVSNGPAYVRMWTLNMTGLQGNSTYHYRVRLVDPVGHVMVSGDYTFTTGTVPNTAPTVSSSTVYVSYNTARTIALVAADAEGNALTYTQVTGPVHGSLVINNSSALYTPAGNYAGPDSFTFKVNDGALDSNTGTVSITVMPTAEVTVVLQRDLNGYSGVKDTTISGYGGEAVVNWGGSGTLSLYSEGSRACALAFALDSIPAGSTVSAAKLETFATSADATLPMYLYRLTRNWVEGTQAGSGTPDGATYHTYDGANAWTTDGGDFEASAVAQYVSSDGTSHWLDWDITSLAQAWVTTPASNFGVLMRNGIWKEAYLVSSEYSDTSLRPKLTITYFPPAETDQTAHGTPYSWLDSHGFSSHVDTVDDDHDGLATWQEYLADTDPTNDLSVLGITNLVVSGSGVQVSWSGGRDAWQILERCTNLTAGAAGWVPCWSNPPPNNTAGSTIDAGAATNGSLFYRIRSHR